MAVGPDHDVFVSCLITITTQKKGDKDPDVVALHGVLVAGGLRACWITLLVLRMLGSGHGSTQRNWYSR